MADIILFVDDDKAILETLGEMLESFGFDVIKASNAEAAIEVLMGVKVSAVLTDFIMPGISGLRFAHDCAQIQPSIPVVIYTGADVGEFTSLYSNVHTVLTKTVSPSILIETMQRAIAEAKANKLKSIAVATRQNSGKS